MAKGQNQKRKLLYLMSIFNEKTDPEHGLTLSEITNLLAQNGIPVDRKTLYSDIDHLRQYGMDILMRKDGRQYRYFLASRTFELAELKLLVDSVQSAKFITEKKSHDLIKKLESLASHYEAEQLHRQVLISGRAKTMNDSILINVDHIHAAINGNHMITFQYFQWTREKKKELRHEGKRYIISPWELVWDDDNYYLVGYEPASGLIKHFRVDKMLHVAETEEKREGKQQMKDFNIASYSQKLFGMFGGDIQNVKLECANEKAGVIIDRFGGKEVFLIPLDDSHFTVQVDVVPSSQFLGWVLSVGGIKIIEPDNVVQKMRDLLTSGINDYL